MKHASIFITGASSGIGAALATEYAAKGVTLGLAARRKPKLDEVKQACEAKDATVHVYQLDVTDEDAFADVAKDFIKQTGGVDLVIANAGVAGWAHPAHTDVKKMTTMINVNVNGVINTVASFIQPMCDRGLGHVAVISSIASFKGLPGGVYSASKAAVRYLMDGWRMDLRSHGVKVTTIFPGFVESEMTDPRRKSYPFLITAGQAARQIKQAIAAEKKSVLIPWQWRFIIPLLRVLPPEIFALATARRDNKYHSSTPTDTIKS